MTEAPARKQRGKYVALPALSPYAAAVLRLGSDGRAAFGTWAALWMYAQRELTDGEVPRDELIACYPAAPLEALEADVARLVAVGLLEQTADGWRIPEYLAFNLTSAEVGHAISKGAERKKAWRDRKRGLVPASGEAAGGLGVASGPPHATPTPAPAPSPEGAGAGRSSPSTVRSRRLAPASPEAAKRPPPTVAEVAEAKRLGIDVDGLAQAHALALVDDLSIEIAVERVLSDRAAAEAEALRNPRRAAGARA